MQANVNVMERLGIGGNVWLSRFFVLALAIVIAWLVVALPVSMAVLLFFGVILLMLAPRKPRWALYLLPFAVPFGSIYEIQVGPAMVGGTEALLGFFLVGWFGRKLVYHDEVLELPRPPLWDLMLAWYTVMLLSVIFTSSLADSLKELVKWAEVFALYAIAVHELKYRDAAIIVGVMLIAGTLEAIDGIYQSWYLIGPDAFRFPMGGQQWLRAYGRFVQPNPYAGYLGLVLPLAYSLLIVMGKMPHLATYEPVTTSLPASISTLLDELGVSQDRFLSWLKISSGLMAVALFLSLSRGGWIGAFAAVAAVTLLLDKNRAFFRLLLIGGMVGGVMAMGRLPFLPIELGNRLNDIIAYINVINLDVASMTLTPGNFSIIERLSHWEAALAMWADSPWLGQGLGNYAAVYSEFYIPPWEDPLGHAHNYFLNVLAETGVLGLIVYLMFWASALQLILKAIKVNTGLWRGLAIGIFATMIHLHVHNVFDNLYVHGMYLQVALLLAIAAKLCEVEKVQEKIDQWKK